MSTKPKWTNVGTIYKGKNGGFYAKVKEAIPAGAIVQLQNPTDKYDRFVAMGKMSQEEADAKKSALPSYVKYELVMPPPDTRTK